MSEKQSIKVGDVVFRETFESLEMKAIVSRMEDDEYWVDLELSGSEEAEEWEPEEATESSEIYAFGCWFDGPGLPVYWGDIDGDGKPELLAPVPKADLSPPLFRIFRWTGEELLFLRKRALIQDSEGEFVWSELDLDRSEQVWIERFEAGKAEIVTLREDAVKRDMFPVEPVKDGFKVSKSSP